MKIEQQGSYLCNGFHDGIGPDDQIRSAPTAKILVIFGTRSEAIKLAPLIKTLAKERSFNIKICATGQHRELLDQVLAFFEIVPDYNFDIMTPDQSLFDITQKSIDWSKGRDGRFSP